jgi:hypothetical protein
MKTQQYLCTHLENKEEFLCEKVEIEGFEVYLFETIVNSGDYVINKNNEIIQVNQASCIFYDKKILCTTNPSLSIPKVFNEVEEMAKDYIKKEYLREDDEIKYRLKTGFIEGYKKAKEEFKWTDKDIESFYQWKDENRKHNSRRIFKNNIRKDCLWEDMNNLTNCPIEYVAEIMIEFAKIKVTAALKCASEKANMLGETQHNNNTPDKIEDFVYVVNSNGSDYGGADYRYVVNKDSILNSYDLTQIK